MGAVHVAILAMAVAFAPASEAFAPASSAILRRAAPGPSIAQLPLRHAALSARRGCSLRVRPAPSLPPLLLEQTHVLSRARSRRIPVIISRILQRPFVAAAERTRRAPR